ncbi:MAG: glycoside hydrolase [Dysgonamonadaceae bacterium]|jgi:photosystem II stability/assembly factor-like uncharacterized protein|nr:glycoside hydrolase [Dysgonamonadaceae bacterium]
MKRTLYLILFQSLFLLTIQAQERYQWGSLPVGGAGFVSGIITCPQEKNLIYARTDVGGAYRWIDRTQSWKPLTDWLPETAASYMGVESMAIDPQEPNKLYLYCGTTYWNNGRSAILFSDDYGETFVEKAIVTNLFPANGNDNGRQSGERMAVDPNKGNILLCGSRTRGLWKSTDGGESWIRLSSATFPDNRKIAFVQYIPSSATKGNPTSEIYIGLQYKGGNNLFVSADGGDTWSPVENQTTAFMPHRCLLSNGKLYITYTDSEGPSTNGTGAIKKYHLASGVWTDISPGNYSFGEVSVDPENSENLITTTLSVWQPQGWIAGGSVTNGDQIFISTDDGLSWKNLFGTSSVSYEEPLIEWLKKSSQLHWAGSVKIDPFNRNRAFIISGNGIYMTENLWDTKPLFKMAVTDLEETVPSDLVSLPNAPVATVIYDYDGFVYHDITQYYDRHTPPMGSTTGLGVAGKNPEIMVRVAGDVYLTENGGIHWSKINKPLSTATRGWCAVSADGKIIVITLSGSPPFYTLDKGVTWTQIPGITSNNVRFFADFEKEDVFYANIGNSLYTCIYNKVTGIFEYTTVTMTGAYNNRLTIVPGWEGEIWYPRNTDGLGRIRQAHQAPLIEILPLSLVTCVGVGKAAPDKPYPSLYIWGKPENSDPVGIYRSDDEGANWVRINDDMHQFGGPGNAQFVKGDMNVYGRVYMSTVGRGIVYGEIQPGREPIQ